MPDAKTLYLSVIPSVLFVESGIISGNIMLVIFAIIIIAAVATPIAKSQHIREIWFYVMSGGVVLKVAVVEIARLIR